MEKVRYGIIGFGNMGSGHCATLAGGKVKNAELTAICDINPKKLEAAKEKYPGVALFDNHIDMLKSGLVDAVEIATPHYFHPPIAIDCFNYGVNVISEKPAGVYTKQVEEMMEAAKKSGKAFGMMFNQRTNPMYQKMREMVQNGELGNLIRCVWIITDWYRTQIYYDSGDWRATWDGEGGGVLLNQCPHQLDLLQWICGLPKTVQAFCQEGKWHDIEVEDDVTAYLQFANGATGVFVTTTGDAPGTNRFEVTGTLGKLVCENDKLTFWKLAQDEREFCRTATEGFAQPQCQQVEVETDGENLQHVGVLNAFAGKILHGTPLVAEGTEGLGGLTLSNAMHLSSWLGRAVDIPFDEELFLSELNKRRATSRKKESKDITFSTEGTY